jgi:hypothetical protein
MAGCGHTDRGSEVFVPNGGFEAGALKPWAPFQAVRAVVVTSPVYEGKFTLAESDAKGSVYQDLNGLASETDYTISARVSWSPDARATAQIAIFDPGTNIANFSSVLAPTPGWQLVHYDFKPSTQSQGTLRVHLFRNEGSGTVFWDDVRVTRKQ